VHAGAPREYLTRPAQRADFHLKDGTHVLLGVASRLVVPAAFGTGDREVFLEGEAYFDVRHDAASKFLVHTATAVTEDIGTAFVVRAYPADSGAQVAVAEGRVVLHSGTAPDGHGTLLSRGQVGKTDRGGPVSVLDAGDLAPYLGWTEGRLVFKDAPLREALPRLSRWFDLDFTLSDSSLGSRRLTASLGDQPTPEMLDLLALSLGVRLERRGDRVTLYARPVAR
jgi:transmembrane sensor